MGWLIEKIVSLFERNFPLQRVAEWELGVVLRWGRFHRIAQPGPCWIIPWVEALNEIETVPAIFSTPLQCITLQDNRTLTYSATVTVQVTDPRKALLEVSHYKETTAELVMSVLSDRLAKVDASRLDPESRGRLLADLRRWLHEECAAYGVDVLAIRFTNFAVNLRTYRLLSQSATTGEHL